MRSHTDDPFDRPGGTTLENRTRIELCRLLLANAVPLTIMAIAFAVIGFLCADHGSRPAFFTIAALGSTIGFARVALSVIGCRQAIDASHVAVWEGLYAAGSYAFSLCLGVLGALAFLERDAIHHMLITALLFGYSSGVVARVSCRPHIAIVSLILAALPIVVTIAIRLGTGYLTEAYLPLAFFILVFLVGSLETVMHLYHTILSLLVTRAEIDGLARRDHLTGLPNRLMIEEQLAQAAVSPRQERKILAVHLLDLDGFKGVNDSFGHAIGDRLLEQVAERLKSAVRRKDLAGRLGGDEFVIIQACLSDRLEAEGLARRIISTLSEPYEIDGRSINIGASVGIATDATGNVCRDVLLEQADRSLYAAKAAGGRRYSIGA